MQADGQNRLKRLATALRGNGLFNQSTSLGALCARRTVTAHQYRCGAYDSSTD
jgi:hypothetical protein